MTDFLNIESDDKAQAAMREAAIETAKLYSVFVNDERGRQLLALWDQQLLNRRVPEGASLDHYARAEALRSFVAGIHEQIRMATQRGG